MRSKRNEVNFTDEDPPRYADLEVATTISPSAPPLQLVHPSASVGTSLSQSSSGYGQLKSNQYRTEFEHGQSFTVNPPVVTHPIVAHPVTSYQNINGNDGITLSASHLPPPSTAVQSAIPSRLSRYSQRVVCPNCKVPVNSVVKYVSGQITHLAAVVVFWFTCCLCCIPYFINELKDAKHTCPHCRTILGYCRRNIFPDVRP